MAIPKHEMTLQFLDPCSVRIQKDQYNKLKYVNKSTGEVFYDVEIKLMFPLSQKAHYIGIYKDNEELGIIDNYRHLNPETRKLVAELMDKQYFIPHITKVLSIEEEFRLIHWKVETNRGPLDFYTRTRNDVVVKGREVYIRDIDSNRYLIRDYTKLDRQSQKNLSSEI